VRKKRPSVLTLPVQIRIVVFAFTLTRAFRTSESSYGAPVGNVVLDSTQSRAHACGRREELVLLSTRLSSTGIGIQKWRHCPLLLRGVWFHTALAEAAASFTVADGPRLGTQPPAAPSPPCARASLGSRMCSTPRTGAAPAAQAHTAAWPPSFACMCKTPCLQSHAAASAPAAVLSAGSLVGHACFA